MSGAGSGGKKEDPWSGKNGNVLWNLNGGGGNGSGGSSGGDGGGGPSLSDLMAAIKGIKGEVREELKEAISEAVGPIKTKNIGIEQSVKNVGNTLGQTVAKVTDLEEKTEGILWNGMWCC